MLGLAVQAQDMAAEVEASLAEAQREKQRLADANAALQEDLRSLRQKQDSAEARVGLPTHPNRINGMSLKCDRASM